MGSKNGKPILREEDTEALAKSSGMEAGDVKKAFDSWVSEHPNGKMKPADFKKMMSAAMPKKDAGKMEKHVFRIYDSNNDGYIDFVEFMVIFHIMADGTSEEVKRQSEVKQNVKMLLKVLEKIFRLFDVNSDGNISNKEMKRLVKESTR